MLIDTHCHLTFPELAGQIDAVLARCDDAGVTKMITIGTDPTDANAAIGLATRHASRIRAAVGVHPHEAARVDETGRSKIETLWDDFHVVACGEMGLDYHYDFADRTAQRHVFLWQLERARTRDKPIVIHCREAFDDVEAMLSDQGFDHRPVVFHCFTGTTDEAARIADHGWRISFTGIVTFPKSKELQTIARAYPADQLMIETDSPYLSPVPLRGKHPNEPARVAHTARFLADLRGESFESLAQQTTTNARAFFGL